MSLGHGRGRGLSADTFGRCFAGLSVIRLSPIAQSQNTINDRRRLRRCSFDHVCSLQIFTRALVRNSEGPPVFVSRATKRTWPLRSRCVVRGTPAAASQPIHAVTADSQDRGNWYCWAVIRSIDAVPTGLFDVRQTNSRIVFDPLANSMVRRPRVMVFGLPPWFSLVRVFAANHR